MDQHEMEPNVDFKIIEANTMDVIDVLQDLDKTEENIKDMCEDIKDLPQNIPVELNSIAVLKHMETLDRS